jgi:hypothetical protein
VKHTSRLTFYNSSQLDMVSISNFTRQFANVKRYATNFYHTDVILFLVAGVAVFSIPSPAIDQDRARDLRQSQTKPGPPPVPLATAFCLSPARWSSSVCASWYSISPMQRYCPVGQKLAAAYPKEATAMMSACIVTAQLVMVPIALLVE